MAGKILDGVAETRRVMEEIAAGVAVLAGSGKKALLAAVQANADPGTDWYARAQAKLCQAHGVEHRLVKLGPGASEADVIAAVRQTGADPNVSAMLVFTPLPVGASLLNVVEAMPPEKDAEGVHPSNLGKLLLSSRVDPAPCTAMAVMELIRSARPDLAGARALVIGRSATVGKPVALLLLAEHATVTIAHTRSDVRAAMLEAEVVVAAAGAAGAKWRSYERKWLEWRERGGAQPPLPNLDPLVTMGMVRRGAVVVDVGDNQVPAGFGPDGGPRLDAKGRPEMRYVGDVDFDKVKEVAGFVTNPRGSVGPLTNAFLLRNVVRAALARQEK